MTKLCLGTVQFGMKYGVNNVIKRQPTWEESFEMLDYAIARGIRVIDTARAYGEAELVLGEYFRNRDNKEIQIISKLRPNVIEKGEKDVYTHVARELEDSFRRMNVDKLNGYLLHTPEYIYNRQIVAALMRLKEEGYVENIGVSIYDLKEGRATIDTDGMDYVQLPYSILDQRGAKEGFLSEARRKGIRVFARSAFLQGMFMMDKTEIPEHLRKAIPHLDVMDRILEKYQVDKISAILHFVAREAEIDYLVFGVETKEQLIQDIDRFHHGRVPEECIKELKELIHNVDETIIFPSLWSNGKKAE